MIPQQFHNDSTTIPHDSTLAGELVPSQRTLESVPANMSASLPLAKTRKLHNSANSPYLGHVAAITITVTVTRIVGLSDTRGLHQAIVARRVPESRKNRKFFTFFAVPVPPNVDTMPATPFSAIHHCHLKAAGTSWN
jgi:hypothetical protein